MCLIENNVYIFYILPFIDVSCRSLIICKLTGASVCFNGSISYCFNFQQIVCTNEMAIKGPGVSVNGRHGTAWFAARPPSYLYCETLHPVDVVCGEILHVKPKRIAEDSIAAGLWAAMASWAER